MPHGTLQASECHECIPDTDPVPFFFLSLSFCLQTYDKYII